MNRRVVLVGSVLILIAILLGAFGAHALRAVLSDQKLLSFETGVRYQMYNGLALLILGFSASNLKFKLNWVFGLILFGTLLFCLSIYLLAMQPIIGVNLSWLGPVTPIGGFLLLLGWSVFIKNLLFLRNSRFRKQGED
jgi:uncharacterized membrane protein YgdD (TMEM256/DUF423 family)